MSNTKWIDKQLDGSYIESDNIFDHALYSGGRPPSWSTLRRGFAFGTLIICGMLLLLSVIILVCDMLV